MPPTTKKIAATMPAVPINQSIILRITFSAEIAASGPPSKAPALPRRAIWIEFRMTLTRPTMARPIKA